MCFLKLLLVLVISERGSGRTSREEREREKVCDFNNIYSTRCFASDQDRVLKEPDVPLIQTEQ